MQRVQRETEMRNQMMTMDQAHLNTKLSLE